MDKPVLRPARRDDCRAIAELFLISSDGLAEYIWSRQAGPGEDLAEVGERRYAREGVDFSYRNCVVAEVDGQVAGMLHAYPMAAAPRSEPNSEPNSEPDSEPEPEPDPDPDPVLAPYGELEEPGSLYISGVAIFPAFRGRGIGSKLMDAAEDKARALGLRRISLICFERNEGAMRLYVRRGYRELDRRPLVPHPCLRYRDGDAILMGLDLEG